MQESTTFKPLPLSPGSHGSHGSNHIQVAVRVRPFNSREKANGNQCVVKMRQNTTMIIHPDHNDNNKDIKDNIFTFDHSFWSHDTVTPGTIFVSQKEVFEILGIPLLENIWAGYDGCIMAYGQTGSGKSYTMLGNEQDPEHKGLIPRVCETIFQDVRFSSLEKIKITYKEIYNEQVRDLLNINDHTTSLDIREHPFYGPYCPDATEVEVKNYQDIAKCMELGSKQRVTAATKMNDQSSRSHALFTLNIYHKQKTPHTYDSISHIHLVDLAGSEKINDSGVTGTNLKEAAKINTSLTYLCTVIKALAKNDGSFIPYRNSKLTYLLKNCLGGNSKTIMIAAISPSVLNYDETLSTLKWANQAKNIVNKVSKHHFFDNIHEEPSIEEKLIEELNSLRQSWDSTEREFMQIIDAAPKMKDFILNHNGHVDEYHKKYSQLSRPPFNPFLFRASYSNEEKFPLFVRLNTVSLKDTEKLVDECHDVQVQKMFPVLNGTFSIWPIKKRVFWKLNDPVENLTINMELVHDISRPIELKMGDIIEFQTQRYVFSC